MKSRTLIISALLLLLFIFSAFMLSGCTKRTPEQTVAGFFKAIEDRDFNKAKTYISTRLKEEVGDTDADYEEMAAPPEGMGDNPFTEENLVSEITGDIAKVWHKDFSSMKWVLKQEGGQWKIDDVEFDFADMLDDIGGAFGDIELPEGVTMPGN